MVDLILQQSPSKKWQRENNYKKLNKTNKSIQLFNSKNERKLNRVQRAIDSQQSFKEKVNTKLIVENQKLTLVKSEKEELESTIKDKILDSALKVQEYENKIKFKLLTGKDEKLIQKDLEQSKKYGYNAEVSTRLRYTITEVDGDKSKEMVNSFAQNMLARDSVAFRKYIADISPDIELTQEIELGGDTVSVSIPLTVEFFWPKSIK